MENVDKKKKRARRRYWISAFFLFLVALVGGVRLQQTLLYWYYFLKLGLWPHPLYFAVSGGMIGAGYSLALIFHFAHFKYTARYIRFLGILLILWIWVDRIWIGIRETIISLLPIKLIITGCTSGLDLLLVRKIEYTKKKSQKHA